jgi:hypothetical protein
VKAYWDTEPDTPEPDRGDSVKAPAIDDHCSMCGTTEGRLVYGPCWPILAERPYSGSRCWDGVACRKRQSEPKPREAAESSEGDPADMLGSTEETR